MSESEAATLNLRCRGFFDRTVEQRREIALKQFEYFEAARKPEAQAEALEIEIILRDLIDQLYREAPPECIRGYW